MRLTASGKDVDDQDFYIDVSARNSGQPKFTFTGNVGAQGQSAEMRVLGAMDGTWQTSSQIARKLGLAHSTVRKHLNALLIAGKVQKRGRTKNVQWRKL